MATLTAYATSGDGFVRNNGSSAWSTLRNAASGTVASQFNPAQVVNDGTTADKYIGRGFFSFDLSSLPPNAVISAATLSLYVTAASSGAGGAVGVTSAAPASTTTLATSDFDDVGSTEYATRKNFASLSTGAYNDFALNAAGLAYLATKLGTVAGFAVRGSFDLDNSAPGTTVYSDCNISTSEQSGTSQDPKLVITYTLVERTTGDTWGWSSPAEVTGRGGGTLLNIGRPSGDTWAWSDSPAVYRRSTADVQVRAAGASCTLSGSQNLSGAGTITVDDTSAFPSSGTAYIINSLTSNQQQGVFTYTGKTSTTFTGCSFTSLLGSTTFAGTQSKIGVPAAESHFPQIVALDETDRPALLISYTQHAGHSVLQGSIRFKTSTDGGMTWGSEQTLIGSPHNGTSYGIYGHVLRRLKNGRLFCMWYEHQMDYTAADSIATWLVMGSYSDDNGSSWSTPVEYDTPYAYGTRSGSTGSGSGFLVYTGPGSNATYGDLYVMIMGNDDGIYVHSSPETFRTYPKLMKVTDGGASGTWTEVATMGTVSDFGGRGASEGDLCIAEDGTWIAHVRVENKDSGETSPYYPYYQRWQMVSSDLGVTWTGHQRVNPLGNSGKIFKLPGGTLVSVGQDIGRAPGTTSYISTDNGATWRFNRVETTDGSYQYYNGSDAVVVIDDADQRNTAFVWADEIASQIGARTMFRWFVDPSRRTTSDTWAWGDVVTSPNRNTSDTWAWADSVARDPLAPARTTADTWAWSDSAAGAQSQGRTSSDTWAWAGTATHTRLTVHASSDTWAWADSAAGAQSKGRETSDTWAWQDGVTRTHTRTLTTGDTWAWATTATTAGGSRYTSDAWAWSGSVGGSVTNTPTAPYTLTGTTRARHTVAGSSRRQHTLSGGPTP